MSSYKDEAIRDIKVNLNVAENKLRDLLESKDKLEKSLDENLGDIKLTERKISGIIDLISHMEKYKND